MTGANLKLIDGGLKNKFSWHLLELMDSDEGFLSEYMVDNTLALGLYMYAVVLTVYMYKCFYKSDASACTHIYVYVCLQNFTHLKNWPKTENTLD